MNNTFSKNHKIQVKFIKKKRSISFSLLFSVVWEMQHWRPWKLQHKKIKFHFHSFSVFPTSCHLLSILSLLSPARCSETQEMWKEATTEATRGTKSLCLFWFVSILFAFSQAFLWDFLLSDLLPPPHRPFSPPDFGWVCFCLCSLLASWVPSSPPDSYLRVLTLLFVYCAWGFTPALLIIPRTTENKSVWVMSQCLYFQQSQPSVECQVLSLPVINFLNDWAQLIIMTAMKRNTF